MTLLTVPQPVKTPPIRRHSLTKEPDKIRCLLCQTFFPVDWQPAIRNGRLVMVCLAVCVNCRKGTK